MWGRGTVERVVHAPDGRLVAVASSRGVYLYDSETLADVRFIPTAGRTYGVAFSPEGSRVAALTEASTEVYRVGDGGLVWRQTTDSYSLRGDVAFSSDGRLLASGFGSDIWLWNAQNGTLIRQMETTETPVWGGAAYEPSYIQQMHFSQDGETLIVARNAPAIDFFRVATGERIWSQGDTGIGWNLVDGLEAQPIALANDGERLVYFESGDPDHIRFLELAGLTLGEGFTLDPLETAGYSEIYISSLAISPSSDLLALGRAYYAPGYGETDDDILILDARDGSLAGALDGHNGPVTTLSFSPDGQTLVSGALDNTVRLWRLSGGAQLAARHEHSDEVFDLNFSPDGSLLAAATNDRRARVWDAPSGDLRYKLGALSAYGYWYEGHIPGMQSLDFSADGRTLATGSDMDAGLVEWDLTTGDLKQFIYAGYFAEHTFSVAYLASDAGLLVELGSVGRGSQHGLSDRRTTRDFGQFGLGVWRGGGRRIPRSDPGGDRHRPV